MLDRFFNRPKRIAWLRSGPLGARVDLFADWLASQGYQPRTVQSKLILVGRLSRWMARERISVAGLREEVFVRCTATLRSVGRVSRDALSAFRLFSKFIHEHWIVPPPPVTPLGPTQRLLGEFGEFLRRERRLVESTVHIYVSLISRFLGGDDSRLDGIGVSDLSRFLLELRRTTPGYLDSARSALRAFFGWLQMIGRVQRNVAHGLPAVSRWRLAAVPDRLSRNEVRELLNSPDKNSNVGVRNYAILLLLARLGLRISEVAALSLDDVDWRGGTVTIRGKRGQQDRLPLPVDAGKALATYIQAARPASKSRRIFIAACAPQRPMSRCAISGTVRDSLRSTGLRQRGSAHLLRHSLATEMLSNGASLQEIGQVLRHALMSTTEIYAKVRVEALRKLALPWLAVEGRGA